ncbi:hypothetical protein GHI93_00070 [Lactococcus hircilactis]|uniref:Uncharacterized protein n=1 Tax=Lactococcus hircilactis TaxID=1494462 RepID=A0A7X2D0S2_9LACT|nr:hypothetical protein [Lactococcus hircilactis]MQW38350.1 hypothetical protein [Lactococcus hircilactis]
MNQDFLNENKGNLQRNMITLIEDEELVLTDEDPTGASTPIISAISATVASATAVSALFGITTACSKSCWHP